VTYRFCPRCATGLEPRREAPEDAERPTCPACGFVHYENPAPTVQAWIERGGEWLFLRRARDPQRGLWNLTGGFVEPFEEPAEAVRREAREELGVEVDVGELIGAFSSAYADTGRSTLDLAYRCRLADEGAELVLSDESGEAGWFALGDVPELAFEGERKALAALRPEPRRSSPPPRPAGREAGAR
jgi:ADP-ribose pyrophosphatase YjhB (NUDIX family)